MKADWSYRFGVKVALKNCGRTLRVSAYSREEMNRAARELKELLKNEKALKDYFRNVERSKLESNVTIFIDNGVTLAGARVVGKDPQTGQHIIDKSIRLRVDALVEAVRRGRQTHYYDEEHGDVRSCKVFGMSHEGLKDNVWRHYERVGFDTKYVVRWNGKIGGDRRAQQALVDAGRKLVLHSNADESSRETLIFVTGTVKSAHEGATDILDVVKGALVRDVPVEVWTWHDSCAHLLKNDEFLREEAKKGTFRICYLDFFRNDIVFNATTARTVITPNRDSFALKMPETTTTTDRRWSKRTPHDDLRREIQARIEASVSIADGLSKIASFWEEKRRTLSVDEFMTQLLRVIASGVNGDGCCADLLRILWANSKRHFDGFDMRTIVDRPNRSGGYPAVIRASWAGKPHVLRTLFNLGANPGVLGPNGRGLLESIRAGCDSSKIGCSSPANVLSIRAQYDACRRIALEAYGNVGDCTDSKIESKLVSTRDNNFSETSTWTKSPNLLDGCSSRNIYIPSTSKGGTTSDIATFQKYRPRWARFEKYSHNSAARKHVLNTKKTNRRWNGVFSRVEEKENRNTQRVSHSDVDERAGNLNSAAEYTGGWYEAVYGERT
eukprot:g2203.t1